MKRGRVNRDSSRDRPLQGSAQLSATYCTARTRQLSHQYVEYGLGVAHVDGGSVQSQPGPHAGQHRGCCHSSGPHLSTQASAHDLVCAPFDMVENDLLVVRTADPGSPFPYYLGMRAECGTSKVSSIGTRAEDDGSIALHWLLPLFKPEKSNMLQSLRPVPLAQRWMEGSRVLMRFDDRKWYHGVVSKCRATRRTCTVEFDDGDCQKHVSFDDPDVLLIGEQSFGDTEVQHPVHMTPVVQGSHVSKHGSEALTVKQGYRYRLLLERNPDYVQMHCLLGRLRMIDALELEKRQVHISSEEHEVIMAVVMRNELAMQNVGRMSVCGPAQGMESVACQSLLYSISVESCCSADECAVDEPARNEQTCKGSINVGSCISVAAIDFFDTL